MGELIEQAALAVHARIIRDQHFGQLAMVLRIERVKNIFYAAGMGY
jgi:hypothetical protein